MHKSITMSSHFATADIASSNRMNNSPHKHQNQGWLINRLQKRKD